MTNEQLLLSLSLFSQCLFVFHVHIIVFKYFLFYLFIMFLFIYFLFVLFSVFIVISLFIYYFHLSIYISDALTPSKGVATAEMSPVLPVQAFLSSTLCCPPSLPSLSLQYSSTLLIHLSLFIYSNHLFIFFFICIVFIYSLIYFYCCQSFISTFLLIIYSC